MATDLNQVLSALATMQSNVATKEKTAAHEYLESFQKSTEAWTATHAILQDSNASVEAKLFAATTLKGKIVYDLHQLPNDAVSSVRDSVIALLKSYGPGPRPIRTQLCVCLASLAIQMTSWKNVLGTVGSAIGNTADGGDCMLDFLRILPEEVTEGRKVNLSEEELADRTKELLEDNQSQVLSLLVSYSQSSDAAATNPRLYECIASWLREIPAVDIVNSPILGKLLAAIGHESSFEAAVECLCTIYHDTRDVDENQSVIQTLFPKIMALRPRITEAAETEDADLMKGITRVFAEAGEAWVVLIARMPDQFHDLVEAVLECCVRDHDKEAIAITFMFWADLKQYLTLEKYSAAKTKLADLYSKLVDVMIKHLQFPSPESGNETDLFDGDRELEDKFREFRHTIGDTLKDCTEVIGVTACLGKAFQLIQRWAQTYGSQAAGTKVPHWQELEAPLFSVRAMGRMVSPEEGTILPSLMPLLTTIPDHEKLKFQSIMAIARYTEWTSQHPETLQAQLQYIISGFNHNSIEVVQAAALAFKYLGTDCARLLGDYISQLQQFYESVLDKLKTQSQDEITEGVAAVVAVQPVDRVYESLKLFCDPVMNRIVTLAEQAKDEEAEKQVADFIGLLVIYIQMVCPYVGPNDENPAVKYCAEILPALASIAKHFTKSIPILERICRCWRYMVISYRTATAPLLQSLATNIAEGFEASRQGCFLWATDAVIREYSYGAEFVDQTTSDNVYAFFAQQATVFFRILAELPPEQLPDVVEDFFRLAADAVRFYPIKTLTSNLAGPMIQASLTALTIPLVNPLVATLQFLRDVLDFGLETPPTSELSTPNGQAPLNPPEVRSAVIRIVQVNGQAIVQRVMTGMMFSFPEDCYSDASAILLALFNMVPGPATQWVQNTLDLLPAGTLKPAEANRLTSGIQDKVSKNEVRKVRVLLQDFTNSYRRRNVAPREGLGRLEAARFRFSG